MPRPRSGPVQQLRPAHHHFPQAEDGTPVNSCASAGMADAVGTAPGTDCPISFTRSGVPHTFVESQKSLPNPTTAIAQCTGNCGWCVLPLPFSVDSRSARLSLT